MMSPDDPSAAKTQGDPLDPAARVNRLGHDLRNSTTVLLGILDHLVELKSQCPPLAEIAQDLDHTMNQLLRFAQELSDLGRDLARKTKE